MLSILVGSILIIVGCLWTVLAFFGGMMASRAVDMWSEVIRPALYGAIPVALGVAIIVWR